LVKKLEACFLPTAPSRGGGSAQQYIFQTAVNSLIRKLLLASVQRHVTPLNVRKSTAFECQALAQGKELISEFPHNKTQKCGFY
jgi:hypothetical protein